MLGIRRPYRRTCRPFSSGTYSDTSYILHNKFASTPSNYIRAFLVLQSDLHTLFEYVDPSDDNLSTYSYRIHALLLRAAIEVESNCKAILSDNCYPRSGNLTMKDYVLVNSSHRLSSYTVQVPHWSGEAGVRSPFALWASGDPLPWYSAYNKTKHDRGKEFIQAKFEHMIDAICAVVVLLSAQFHREDFVPRYSLLAVSSPTDGFENAIGDFFRVSFPTDWPDNERYDFKWTEIESDPDPFETFPYVRP